MYKIFMVRYGSTAKVYYNTIYLERIAWMVLLPLKLMIGQLNSRFRLSFTHWTIPGGLYYTVNQPVLTLYQYGTGRVLKPIVQTLIQTFEHDIA